MPHRHILVLTLLALSMVGAGAIVLVLSASGPRAPHLWWLFLVVLPLGLVTVVLMGKSWAAMVCVAYGTIGLALDLATVISVLGRGEDSNVSLALSIVSGSANLVLIIFGGRASWAALEGPWPPKSRPPSPPSPSSSSRI